MKKLSLLLLTLCVSLAGWANESDPYRLNPFAYDLSSSWDEASQKLTVRFKVNSVPNLEDVNGWSCGIQVFAVDSREKKYYIWGTPGNTIRNAHNGGAGTYEYVADLSSGLDLHGNLIPRNEDLTWMVRVAGRGNESSTAVSPGNNEPKIDYTLPRFWNFQNSFSDKRYISPSIAANTSPETPNFGDIYIIDNMNPSSHTSTKWSAVNTGRGIYVYKPDFKTKAYSGDKVAIDPTTKQGGFKDTSEPRDLCVSKDGRVFVCSYSTASEVAVWELENNYTTWTPILNKEDITRKVTGGTTNKHSVVSMDVKGEGDDITLLLLCKGSVNNNNNNNNSNFPLLKCVEYNVSTETLTEIQLPQQIYDFVYYNEGINAHARIAYDDTNNWIWCGFGTKENKSWVRAFDPTIANDKNNVNKNLKVNEEIGEYYGGEAFCVKGNMLIKSIQGKTYDRPSIIFRTIDRSKTDVTAVITDNPCFTYNGDVNNSLLDADLVTECYNDFALDYANNLYVANNWSGQVFPISLPYDGIKDTPAPSNQKFKLRKAVPNILATDLKYEPVGTTDKYAFSFITNTKPTVAEIRFYKKNNRGNMDSNIATIHADNYDENAHKTIEPDYVYRFQGTELKQGLMEKTFTMVGGDPNQKELTDALPPGEMYWSVYVETEKSTCFAPIYRSGYYPQDSKYEPLHAVVNNYPATDMFGQLIVTNNNDYTENRPNNGLLIYGLNPSDAEQKKDGVNTTRFIKRTDYLNGDKGKNGLTFLNYPRRMAITSDGKVYIADEGQCPVDDYAAAETVAYHNYGGVKIWDPASPNEFKLFSDNKIKTSTSVALWNGTLYATNTYEEYLKHISGADGSASNYTKSQQYVNGVFGWNGFVEYNLDAYYQSSNNGTWEDFWKSNSRAKEVALGRGDESGNITLVPMEKGIWICQSREDNWIVKKERKQPLADNLGSYLLSFVPFSRTTTTNEYGPRTWRTCTTDGIKNYTTTRDPDSPSELTQKENSLLQSTPGAGMAYRKVNGVEYLYIVNHEGNILQMQIEWQNNTTPLIHESKITKFQTPSTFKYNKDNGWKNYSFINSMDFDYAGNLVTITGDRISHFNKKHEIVIYTMAYDRTNAQEIRASDSYIYIPERLHQMVMHDDIQYVLDLHKNGGACAVDLYRPLQGGMFNTICLPFGLDMNHENNPLADAEVRQFKGAKLETIGGERILCLEFNVIEELQSNVPYIIKPEKNIKQIMRFNWPVTLATTTDVDAQDEDFEDGNNITYQGLLSKSLVAANPLRLILVADNRLAVITKDGDMYGFRGYFDLLKPLPPGTVAKISAKKDTPTNTTIVVDGKKVNIEKYLREGRVYIRVGDSLYTIDGQVVE